METNLEIAKPGKFQAVSFSNDRNRDIIQHKIIIRLLNNSIKEQRQITIIDIVNAYVEWRFYGIEVMHGFKKVYNELGWKFEPITTTPEDFRNEWNINTKAKGWFKNNLGGAIIKGKILAIPIIEI
jgi:hypothetical protein